MVVVTVGALVTAIPLSIGAFVLGQYAIPRATPAYLMYAWDGLLVAFLFFWSVGVVTELQRTEPLSLAKFMHLPVSVTGAFLINYLSSLLRLSLIVFGPIMLGFCLRSWLSKESSCARLLAVGGFLPDGDCAYLSASGLAGLIDEQSSPPADRGRGHDRDLRVDCSTTESAQLSRTLGPAQQIGRSAKFKDEIAKINHAYEAGEFDAQELLRRTQEAMDEQKRAMRQRTSQA